MRKRRMCAWWVAGLVVVVVGIEAVARWDHFIAPGFAFQRSDSYTSYNVTSLDQCKMMCSVVAGTPQCMAWTAVRQGPGAWTCLHASHSPPFNTLTTNTNSVMGYTEDSLKGELNAVQAEDGHYYFIPSSQANHNFDFAKQYCQNLPGFRLAIFYTFEQMQMALNLINKNVYIGLQNNGNGFQWGDGTPFPSELSRLIWNYNYSNDPYVRTDGNNYQRDHNIDLFLCQH
ncbi:uncharacterized protein [Procambarus clarkii]|uniref:uncharacterized protein n=1 Tax=Procambarus clarkii TaxID=6728 RepID=UPI001E675685|nr:uncharacterized protein LOC123760552 [Procambarus clarkii]